MTTFNERLARAAANLPAYAEKWLAANPYQAIAHYKDCSIQFWYGTYERCASWIETEAKEQEAINGGKIVIEPMTREDAVFHFSLI